MNAALKEHIAETRAQLLAPAEGTAMNAQLHGHPILSPFKAKITRGLYGPNLCLARISRGPLWCRLDDVAFYPNRQCISRTFIRNGRWHVIHIDEVPGILSRLGDEAKDRLRLRMLPTRKEQS